MKKLLTFAIATLAVVGFSGLAMPTQAHADPHCMTGRYCIYDGTSFTNSVVSMSIPAVSGGCNAVPYAWADNMASSHANGSDYNIRAYDGAGCTGSYITINAHTEAASLGTMNNKITSYMRL